MKLETFYLGLVSFCLIFSHAIGEGTVEAEEPIDKPIFMDDIDSEEAIFLQEPEDLPAVKEDDNSDGENQGESRETGVNEQGIPLNDEYKFMEIPPGNPSGGPDESQPTSTESPLPLAEMDENGKPIEYNFKEPIEILDENSANMSLSGIVNANNKMKTMMKDEAETVVEFYTEEQLAGLNASQIEQLIGSGIPNVTTTPTPTLAPSANYTPPAPELTPLEAKQAEFQDGVSCVGYDYARCSLFELDTCTHFRTVKCKNGAKCQNAQCKCDYCYSNADCGWYNDMASPMFKENHYEVKFYTGTEQTFSQIKAVDDDAIFCRSLSQGNCPCSVVVYSLKFNPDTNEEIQKLFEINQETGELKFLGSSADLPETLTIYIVAGNPTPEQAIANQTVKMENRVPFVISFSTNENDKYKDIVVNLEKEESEQSEQVDNRIQEEPVVNGEHEKEPVEELDQNVDAESLKKSFGNEDQHVVTDRRRKRSVSLNILFLSNLTC